MLHAIDHLDVGDIGPVQRDVQVQLHDMAAAEPKMQDQFTGLRRAVVRVGVDLQFVCAVAGHVISPLKRLAALASPSSFRE